MGKDLRYVDPAGTEHKINYTEVAIDDSRADLTMRTWSQAKINQEVTKAKKLEEATGNLSVTKGGTGANTSKAAQFNLLNDMQTETSDVIDDTFIVCAYNQPTAGSGIIFKRSAVRLWNYIKSKIESLALTFTGNTTFNGTVSGVGIDNMLADRQVNSNPEKFAETFFGSTDFNDFLTTGFYRINEINNYSNAPVGASSYGQLIVSHNQDTIYQQYSSWGGESGNVYVRCFNVGGSGYEWKQLATTDGTVANATNATHADNANRADRASYASYAADLGANGFIFTPRIFFRTVYFHGENRTYGDLTITYTGRTQVGSGQYSYNYVTNLSLLLMSRPGSTYGKTVEFKRVKAGESLQLSTGDEYWDVLCELAENTGSTDLIPGGTPIQATTYKDRNGDVIDTSVFDAISQPINP